jgi:hypothetical protein
MFAHVFCPIGERNRISMSSSSCGTNSGSGAHSGVQTGSRHPQGEHTQEHRGSEALLVRQGGGYLGGAHELGPLQAVRIIRGVLLVHRYGHPLYVGSIG